MKIISILSFGCLLSLQLGTEETNANVLFDTIDLIKDTILGTDDEQLQQAPPPKFSKTKHAHEGISVVDHSTPGLPKLRTGHRVIDLTHADLFDEILQDTPDELRPPSVIAYYDSNNEKCMKDFKKLKWDYLAERELPARERLAIFRYDTYAAPRRSWYKFTPEMDLAARHKVKACPEVVFVPRNCTGFTDWCVKGKDPTNPAVNVVGCENFHDQCKGFESWDNLSDLKAWILARVRREGEPHISPFLRTYKEQGEWMKQRDSTSVDNQHRNLFLSPAFPAFSKTNGYKALPIPQEFQDWLVDFYKRNRHTERIETWDSASTQMSFVEIKTRFVDLDRERREKERMANKYLKPIIEEWAGVEVELTSFYGLRTYPDGSFLKGHVDRIDTHVLSVTMSILKLNETKAKENPWPIEVIDWKGEHVRYDHPGGTMVLYESAKNIHGRAYRNRGGDHIGAFCHFAPKMDWSKEVQAARQFKDSQLQRAQYRSTNSIEPQDPVYSDVKYGESTRWRHISPSLDGDEDDSEEEENSETNGSFSVTFSNQYDQSLDIYWVSSDGALVHQGMLAPKASFAVNTYAGHRFVWTLKGSKKPLKTMTADPGRRMYAYKN